MTTECPACGGVNDDAAVECERCHLATSLFPEVRAAAGDAHTDPHYLRVVSEMLAAVDDGAGAEADRPPTVEGRLSHPLRFPAIGAPPTREEPVTTVPGLESLPALPALPPGADFAVLRHQVDEYLQLGRRQGIDLSEFSERAQRAILVQDRESVEVLSRELFVYLAASLGEEFGVVCAKRNELAALVATTLPDAELDACRHALLIGDLGGARRRLSRVAETLGQLEEEWETVQILITESELIAEEVRELHGDPTPALGPLEAGRALARDGRREEAERVLAHATLALWTILTPLFSRELARTKQVLLEARAGGADVAVPVAAMRELAAALRLRNLALGVTWFRRLREAVDALPVTGPSDADRPTGRTTPDPAVVAPDEDRSTPLAPAPQP